jgi:MmyB-like transcription regulator ligand binding domain
VATLRAEAGRNPYDKALSDLIGELSTRGDTFRQRWARHEVRRHRAGAKRLNHPIVGPMTFTYETMELAADEGLYLIVCGTAPGSPDADTLNLLASWHAHRQRGKRSAQAELNSRSHSGRQRYQYARLT